MLSIKRSTCLPAWLPACCLVGCVALFATNIFAQETEKESEKVKKEPLPALNIETYSANEINRSLPIDSMSVGVLAGTAISSYTLYNFVDERYVPDFHIGGSAENSQMISLVGEAAAISMPFTFLLATQFFDKDDPRYHHTARVTTELFTNLALTVSTTYLLKYSVNRDRPDSSDQFSFPSAHTAETFACATTLALNYPWYVGATSYAAATAVGLSRFDLEKHFLSDVVTGAGIGLFYGLATHLYFKPQPKQSLAKRAAPQILPLVADEAIGLTFQLAL